MSATTKPDRSAPAPEAAPSKTSATSAREAAPVGPLVERGQVTDFKPAPLPPAPGPATPPTEAEQREMGRQFLGLDEEQMQTIEAPVVTADSVVRLTEVGVYILARFRTISKRRPWDAEKATAARFTPGAREDIKAFAPFAQPFLQQSAAANPWVGLAFFGAVAWSAAGDSFARVAEIEKTRGEVKVEPTEPAAAGRVAGPPIVK